MTDSSGAPEQARSEADPPAANQPLGEKDLEQAGDTQSKTAEVIGEPEPTPVPVAAPHGGQVPPGKPDGEVDTRA
jgi:hypothetical protein